ncbi:porin [Thiomicrorhabdus lithotrophica]|uniref:OprO/OprP family phosphate-selective porin n=1 Tax=Thiomicrorhabdus lithotrophica TaxID=2949997 RepID=A0ABY8C9S0_9GAMM|nr:porin [Thiomicrorhabdus lithotrophica]WEJ62723.1 OprO/OprP family phosphate-selective porin [Thiomicrorhabdus lithotrophica]
MLNKKHAFKKTAILLALTGVMASQSAQAANWLMLQGTEKADQAPRAKLWGFAQIDYQQTDDTLHPNGSKAAFNQMQPQLTTASGFNVKRARIGVRGANFPLDKNVNYFLMTELGNNGITTGENGSQGQLTDASITLNHFDGARVRVGLFKTPGSEESFKGIPVFNYVNFTNGTDRLLIERKIDGTVDANNIATGIRTDAAFAVRDTGIQVFDTFKQGDWEHSYAIMYGNGNGLALSDNDKNKDLYLYASTEKVFGESQGPRRKSMKFYAWSQDGKRTYDGTEYNRDRAGLGMTYYDGKYRVAAEYFTADGMIFGGPKSAVAGNPLTVFTDQKATAYQLDLGYRIKPNIELNARYDVLDSATETDMQSGTNGDKHRIFTTTTLGAQYFFNKKTSVRLNYEIRDIDAPDAPDAAPVHNVLDSLDNRVSAQLMMVF